jgi:steroid delta-isomerase
MPNTCQQTVAEYFASIRAMDIDRFLGVFAPDAVSHDPVGAPPHVGHDALRAFFEGICASVTEFNLAEQSVYAGGNSAAIKWIANGKGKNGKPVTFEGVDVIDCNEQGKIVLVRAFWDPGPVMAILQS